MRFLQISTKKLYITILYVVFMSISDVSAQGEINFINAGKNKIIKVQTGNELIVLYKGYLGQTEYIKQVLLYTSDSSLVVGNVMSLLTSSEKAKLMGNEPKEILFKDIIAFRKITIGRAIVKSLVTSGMAFGSYFLLRDIYRQNQISTLGAFGISLGVGVGSTMLITNIFSDKPKYFINQGWNIQREY